MKVFKILLSVVILGTVLAAMAGCSAPSEEVTPESQVTTVTRGNITLDITAAGNLALSFTEDLAIDLFFQEGTIAEVLVEAGDTVEEGQVLVRLDADEWDDEMSTLEDLVTTKERALVTAQINLQTAEQNLKNARDNEATKELAVLNAQISLDQAVNNLAAGVSATDYELALAELRMAQAWYEYVSTTLNTSGLLDTDDYTLTLEQAQERLDIAQTDYDNTLTGYDTREINLKKKQVESAELTLANAEEDLADVASDVALKELSLTLTQGNLEDAEKALSDAQEDLEEAREKSPEIVAPFDGFVTLVNVEGGDEVLTGTIAVQVADPDKFEADILVSEMDILQVKLGGDATVQADAISGYTFPAKVTHISPTATIQSGVVNYAVRVELEPLESIVPASPTGFQMPELAEGELPPFLQMAVEAGRMTEEEAKELMEMGPPEGFTPPEGGFGPPPEGFEFPEDFEFPEGFELPAFDESTQPVLPELSVTDIQLREGLTVTVSIIVAESVDVLLVPNAAITWEGSQGYVEVVTGEVETEKRAVQTGLSDYQFTEITEGLDEGEQIIVPSGTVTVTTDEEDEPPRMGLFGPRR